MHRDRLDITLPYKKIVFCSSLCSSFPTSHSLPSLWYSLWIPTCEDTNRQVYTCLTPPDVTALKKLPLLKTPWLASVFRATAEGDRESHLGSSWVTLVLKSSLAGRWKAVRKSCWERSAPDRQLNTSCLRRRRGHWKAGSSHLSLLSRTLEPASTPCINRTRLLTVSGKHDRASPAHKSLYFLF